MDDSLSALQFSRTIEREIQVQSAWLKQMDFSNARALDPKLMYKSTSLTHIDLSQCVSVKEQAPNCKRPKTKEQFERSQMQIGLVYPKASEFTQEPQWFSGEMPDILKVKRFPNGQALKKDVYRTHGAFTAQLDRDF
jgi:hypothetical protein